MKMTFGQYHKDDNFFNAFGYEFTKYKEQHIDCRTQKPTYVWVWSCGAQGSASALALHKSCIKRAAGFANNEYAFAQILSRIETVVNRHLAGNTYATVNKEFMSREYDWEIEDYIREFNDERAGLADDRFASAFFPLK